MKYSTTALIVSLLLASSSTVIAATDTKTIDIEVVKGQFVQLTGSAIDSNVKNITLNSVTGNSATDLGTLGVNSNIAAGEDEEAQCNVKFTTINNYTLKHTKSGGILKKFSLNYLGKNIASNNPETNNLAVQCKQAVAQLKFTPYGENPETIAAGTYKDTVTIVITSP